MFQENKAMEKRISPDRCPPSAFYDIDLSLLFFAVALKVSGALGWQPSNYGSTGGEVGVGGGGGGAVPKPTVSMHVSQGVNL